MTATASFTVKSRASSAFSVEVQLPGEGLAIERAEVSLRERGQLGLEAAGRTDEPDGEVGAVDEGQRRPVHGREEWDPDGGWRAVDNPERQAHGADQIVHRRRQRESVERRIPARP